MGKQYAIWGGGNKSLEILRIIKNNNLDIECQYFVEGKNLNKVGDNWETDYGIVKIISMFEMKELYDSGKISGVIYPTTYHVFDWNDIQKHCLELGIPKDRIFGVPLDIIRKEVLSEADKRRVITPYEELRQIHHVEFHVTDNCNIKCRGCGHFACLVDEKDTAISADRIISNFKKLREYIDNINEIMILGGEPLLHPELGKIIEGVSDIFPYSQIHIITNGILLTQMTDNLVKIIKQRNVIILYSMYRALYKNMEKNIAFLKKNDIRYSCNDANTFERRLTKKPIFDGKIINKKCGHCVCMSDNYIAKCPWLAFIHYYNERFGNLFPDNGKIDIYSVKSTEELFEKIDNGGDLCNYCCGRDTCHKDWELVTRENISPDDWLIDFYNYDAFE